MDDINSKLSQLYDNELNQDQLDDVLKNLNSNRPWSYVGTWLDWIIDVNFDCPHPIGLLPNKNDVLSELYFK